MTERSSVRSNDEVRAVMRSPVVALDPGATLRTAATVLAGNHIGAVAVVGPAGLVGVLSERDVVQALAGGLDPDRAEVDDAMSDAPKPVDAAAPVWAAATLMLERGFRHLPVTEGDRVVGMLSIRDALAVIERDRLIEPRTTIEPVDGDPGSRR
jgi:CBS domain-containing protein